MTAALNIVKGRIKLASSEAAMGLKDESEHPGSEKMHKQIVRDHLKEDPKYYTHLRKMQKLVESGKLPKAASADFVPFQLVAADGTPKGTITLEISASEEARRAGLSKYASLPQDRGMLFTKAGFFWMRGMSFPIDIVFLDKEGAVLERQHMPLEKSANKVYGPKTATAHVAVELPVGWAERHNLIPGDKFVVAG